VLAAWCRPDRPPRMNRRDGAGKTHETARTFRRSAAGLQHGQDLVDWIASPASPLAEDHFTRRPSLEADNGPTNRTILPPCAAEGRRLSVLSASKRQCDACVPPQENWSSGRGAQAVRPRRSTWSRRQCRGPARRNRRLPCDRVPRGPHLPSNRRPAALQGSLSCLPQNGGLPLCKPCFVSGTTLLARPASEIWVLSAEARSNRSNQASIQSEKLMKKTCALQALRCQENSLNQHARHCI